MVGVLEDVDHARQSGGLDQEAQEQPVSYQHYGDASFLPTGALFRYYHWVLKRKNKVWQDARCRKRVVRCRGHLQQPKACWLKQGAVGATARDVRAPAAERPNPRPRWQKARLCAEGIPIPPPGALAACNVELESTLQYGTWWRLQDPLCPQLMAGNIMSVRRSPNLQWTRLSAVLRTDATHHSAS